METIFTTKEKIMDTSIRLFSEKGYDKVSMREIAATVGIRAASIYNHYPSKGDILQSIYDFYAQERKNIFPNLEVVLPLLETEPIRNVLMKLQYFWPAELQERMDRILLIASQRIYLDKNSEHFVRENFFEPLIDVWGTVLKRAIELGKIKPINVDSYTRMITYYAFCVAGLNGTAMKITLDQWNSTVDMFFMLLESTRC